MDDYQSLSHTKWECKYHVVFIPKCRRKTLYRALREHLGKVFRDLALRKESRVEEGHLMPDHVHMMLTIPRNTRYRRWWATSKGRARFTLLGSIVSASATSWGSTSGHAATSFPPWAETRK